MSESASQESKKSVGEELFLVHLSRQTKSVNSPDDLDLGVSTKRDRDTTVGEELWRVHCQRAGGRIDDDYEGDEVNNNEKVLHLRNRDVKCSVQQGTTGH